MTFFDILLAAFLAYAFYKGLKNGLFVELSSFVSLIIGIYVALKFSYFIQNLIQNAVTWQPKYIQIAAFGLTFLAVVTGIHLLAKFFTSLADFAYLGWINKLSGAGFSVLKTVLALSIVFHLFQKININNIIVKQQTLDNSIFYNPIQEVSKWMYPSLEASYEKLKEKVK